MNHFEEIISYLPYKFPFFFVDELLKLNDDRASGIYTIKENEYYFNGHFPNNPVVPGAILGEIMAQIGLVCLGIHLSKPEDRKSITPAFTEMNIDFLSFARPGDRLFIESEKIYFRFGKLKCKILCKKEDNTLISKGEMSGVIINQKKSS